MVAEGVETEKHRKDVTAAGATHIQGYHLSTPVLLDTNECSASEQGFLLECSVRDGEYQIALEHGIGSNTFKVPGPVFLHED